MSEPTQPPAYYGANETRTQYLLRTGKAKPVLLQGVYPFAGRGVHDILLLNADLAYTVPAGHTAEVLYFRAGNHSDDLIYLTLMVDDKPVRYFPVGPKADIHVPLAIIEQYPASSRIHVGIGAPRGLSGTVVIDMGVIQTAEGL